MLTVCPQWSAVYLPGFFFFPQLLPKLDQLHKILSLCQFLISLYEMANQGWCKDMLQWNGKFSSGDEIANLCAMHMLSKMSPNSCVWTGSYIAFITAWNYRDCMCLQQETPKRPILRSYRKFTSLFLENTVCQFLEEKQSLFRCFLHCTSFWVAFIFEKETVELWHSKTC